MSRTGKSSRRGRPLLDWSVSAPGKLFLGGEYAVLGGAEAVVTAVDRRTQARLVTRPPSESPIVTAARHAAIDALSRPDDGPEPPYVKVTSSGFQIGRRKIGLGSSASACASAVGALFEWGGQPVDVARERVLEVAMGAHREAQGGRGSGADVAAAVRGGTFVFRAGRVLSPVDISRVVLVPVWSGRAASTTELIGKIIDYERRDPAGHRALLDELDQCAADLAAAYRTGEPAAIVSKTAAYGRLMDRLGHASGAPIVTTRHRLIAQLASNLGGTAKPSGAGGGDVAVAVFDDPGAGRRFSRHCLRHELTPLDISLDAPGLRREA
jgi:phosphomevalonate kinase